MFFQGKNFLIIRIFIFYINFNILSNLYVISEHKRANALYLNYINHNKQ